MKKKLLILAGILVFFFIIGKACSSENKVSVEENSGTTTTTPTKEVAEDEGFKLPENKFDTSISIPGTKLILKYPSKGFYQLGAVVKTNEPGAPDSYGNVLTIQAKEKYNNEKGSEFITLVTALREADPNEKILKNVNEILNPNQVEIDYAKNNGSYKTINGQEFFVYKVDEVLTLYKAITLQNNQVIIITLMYKPTDGKESEAAFKNNDKLLIEILENISYK